LRNRAVEVIRVPDVAIWSFGDEFSGAADGHWVGRELAGRRDFDDVVGDAGGGDEPDIAVGSERDGGRAETV